MTGSAIVVITAPAIKGTLTTGGWIALGVTLLVVSGLFVYFLMKE